jgi:hypothetical protein
MGTTMTGKVLYALVYCLLATTYIGLAANAEGGELDPLQTLLNSMSNRAYPAQGMDSRGALGECSQEQEREKVSDAQFSVTFHSLRMEGSCYQWRDFASASGRCIIVDKPVIRRLSRSDARLFLSATLLPQPMRRIDIGGADVRPPEPPPCENTELGRARTLSVSVSKPYNLLPPSISPDDLPSNVSFAPPMSYDDLIAMLSEKFAADLTDEYYWFESRGDTFVLTQGTYYRVASLTLVVPNRDCRFPATQYIDVWFATSGAVIQIYAGPGSCLA